MRILFAGDEHPYSAYALKKVIELAKNTWADVTLLAVNSAISSKEIEHPLPAGHPLAQALHRFREDFIQHLGEPGSPYAPDRWAYEWILLKNGLWEQIKVCRGNRKDLKVHLRSGIADSEILTESKKEGSDLIILGCSKGGKCVWEEPAHVPQTIVSNAGCSVLLVKEDKPIQRILACIEQSSVSQESLEMINQMVTIHKAQLELVGLTKEGGAKPEAYSRLIQIGDYYSDKGISVKCRLSEIAEFESFISTENQHDLLAFWMGKKSLLTLLFPKDWMERFISTCRSSVLVLR